MLVSVASFLPIIIVGPISDLVGTTAVIFVMAIGVTVIGVVSVVTRGPLRETDAHPAADPKAVDPIASALGADRPTWHESPTPSERPPTQAPPPAAGPIPPVAAPLVPGPEPDPGLRAGPADPTDRA
jgi:hypothetical protein